MFDITATYLQNKPQDLSITWLVISQKSYKYAILKEHDGVWKMSQMSACVIVPYCYIKSRIIDNYSNVHISYKNRMSTMINETYPPRVAIIQSNSTYPWRLYVSQSYIVP